MANPIDIIVTQDALKGVDAIIARVDLLDKKLLETAQLVIDTSKKIASISTTLTPANVNNSGNNNAKLLAELDAMKAKYVALNDAIVKKAEQSRLAEIRLQQKREKAFDAFEKNAQKEATLNAKNEGSYQRIQNSVNKLTNAYNNLAIRKQLGASLSEKEEKQLTSLTTRINTYQTALKTVDANMQKNQRNVGNYASGYNALGNSINQLSREAPAFANSVNTGFMALSNNFPALFDAISGIRRENAALVAEGKPTTSLFKQLVSGIFSWQTLLSVGVTLLTLYGGKLVEFASKALKGKDTIKSLAENQQLLNDTLKESSGSYAEEKVNIEVLYKTANDLNKSYKDRKRAVDELQQLYPAYFGNLTDEAIMTGQAKDQYLLLSNAIVTVAKARASEEILQKRESERLVIEQEQINKTMQKYKELAKAKGTTTYVAGGGSVAGAGTTTVQETAEQQRARLRREIQNLRNESVNQRDAWAKEDSFFIEKIAQGNAIEQTLKPAEKARKEKIKKEKKARREDIEGLQNHIKTVSTLIEEINTEIQRLETEKMVANADELPSVNFQLEQLIKLKKELNGIPKVDFTINVPVKQEDIEKVKEMTEGIKNYLQSFSAEFMSNSGFTETFRLLNDEIEGFGENFAVTFNAIAESAQEAFNFISNASQANFDNERKRIEDQQAIAISYAGGSAVAIAKINEDAEKRKKDIANRENKSKQKQAIFNIAIDTAQGIVSALASTPPNIPLSILIGALGAVQIGIVASQKIPQYWMGGTHDGGLMMVNDGNGSNFKETIVTPDGKIMKPQGRNVIMDAPAGTEIYTESQWSDQLQNMLQGKGIEMSKSNQYYGITKNDMYEVMADTLGTQTQHYSNFDAEGATDYIIKGGNKTVINRNRGNGRGSKF